VALFVVLALGIGWVVLSVPAVAGIPFAPFLLALVFLGLLAPALVVSRMADGPGAIRRLLSRAVIWRFSIVRWAIVVFGVPVLTLVVAAATGTLQTPEGGWTDLVTTYLVETFVTGLLIISLWEEMAWAGFAQTRLMASRGLLVGSLLTALAFAAVHIPLQFEGDWTWADVAVGLAALIALSPFARYLIGMHLLDTRGSVLAAGVQHASWNAAQKLDAVEGGDWQMLGAVILLTLLLAVGRRIWRPEAHSTGADEEKAAASEWTALHRAEAQSDRSH
jgi:membrane protease YdiL (CAAX protease family)